MAVARDLQFSCSDTGQEQIQKDIAELKLDRVVVAACSPRLHEPTFRRAITKAGSEPLHAGDGQHPGAVLLGAHGPAGHGHREGQGPA
ncbi:MAG: hypothetical protein MZV70_74615 [Desulfobacterales bacterium]|nr:hypothetical protein [Desulfobacterales bacterium]